MCVGEEFAEKFWFCSALWLSSSILLVLGLRLPFLIALLTFVVLTKLELPLLSLSLCGGTVMFCNLTLALLFIAIVVEFLSIDDPQPTWGRERSPFDVRPVQVDVRTHEKLHSSAAKTAIWESQKSLHTRQQPFFPLYSVPWALSTQQVENVFMVKNANGRHVERSSNAMWRESWSFQAAISGVVTEVDFGTAPRIDFNVNRVKLVNRNNKHFFLSHKSEQKSLLSCKLMSENLQMQIMSWEWWITFIWSLAGQVLIAFLL